MSATATRPPLPHYLQIEPVGQCNLRCQMCPIQFRRDGPPYGPPAFMAWETFTTILDDMPELTELHLQGLGEPMMHPRFFDMVEYAVARGIHVTTNSNFTLLPPWRAPRCVRSGLAWAHVSIDGATAETYERIRVRSSLSKVLRNLDGLLAARDAAGATTPHLRMVTVAMRQNVHELPALVELAHRFRFEGVWVQHLCHDFGESSLPSHYRPMRDFVQAQSLLGANQAQVARSFDAARETAAQLGVELRLPRLAPLAFAPDTPGPERCDWPWHGAYVSYQGYAMPCCMVATPDRMNFGNVQDHGLRDVWHSPAYEAFRAQLASAVPPAICRSCSVYTHTF